MMTFFMFGKYSLPAIKGIKAERTKKAVGLIKKMGGGVHEMYVLTGEHDLVLIVEFPDIEAAMKASIALTKMTGISFATSAAVTVERFDNMTVGL